MIGNDIVALGEAKKAKNWQNQRFLDKIFTKNEQKHIKSAENQFAEIWKLWSLKESAYKLYVQQFKQRFYAPIQFECVFLNNHITVLKDDFKCFTKTHQCESFVFSVAYQENLNEFSHCFKLQNSDYKFQSDTTSLALKKAISKHFSKSIGEIDLFKSECGIPRVYYKNQALPVDVSLTHHGNYGAFSIAYK